MTITVTKFDPAGNLGGKKGLHKSKGSKSSATLYGTGLVDNLTVNVLHPPQSQNPALKWTGTTANSSSDHTQCTVDLEQKLEPPSKRDDNTTISVTASSATETSAPLDTTVTTGA